jgi:hypothetical protein
MGIQNAIQTALWASIVINTTLQRPEAEAVALGFYQDKIGSCAAAHAAAVGEIYASHAGGASAPFWMRRSTLQMRPVVDAPTLGQETAPLPSTPVTRGSARVVDHACLCGDYVETRRAVLVRGGDEPVAFLSGLALGDIIDRVEQDCAFGDLQEWLAARLSAGVTAQLTAWLFRNDVIRAL